jgi:hypothetical protein
VWTRADQGVESFGILLGYDLSRLEKLSSNQVDSKAGAIEAPGLLLIHNPYRGSNDLRVGTWNIDTLGGK